MEKPRYYEHWIVKPSRAVFFNIVLLLIMFLSAEFGRQFGIDIRGLSITVLWPPTGIALTAILLFGYRVLPGIFLANFFYDFYYLYPESIFLFNSIFASLVVAFGSTLEVLVGGYIMRKYTSGIYLTTTKNVFLFLLFGGAITCLIGSLIGVTTLNIYGTIPEEQYWRTFLTFWIGDTFGIYILTPLLVVWLFHPKLVTFKNHIIEAFAMGFVILAIVLLSFFASYPISQFFLPVFFWVTYRFYMRGATLAILVVTFLTLFPTQYGLGVLSAAFIDLSLLVLVSYLSAIIASSMIFASVLYERERAWHFLESHVNNLQEQLEEGKEEIEMLTEKMILKEKRASLGMMTLTFAKQIRLSLTQIKEVVSSIRKKTLAMEDKKKVESLLEEINTIEKLQENASSVVLLVKDLSKKIQSEELKVKLINIKTLVNVILDEFFQKDLGFPIRLEKKFRETLPMIPAIPDELKYALKYYIETAVESMKKKWKQEGEAYSALLYMFVDEHEENITIFIESNGLHTDERDFEPRISANREGESKKSYRHSLAHDIIVYLHRGKITVEILEDRILRFSICLPRSV